MDIKSKITATAILCLAIAGCTIGGTPEANQPDGTPTTPEKPAEKTATPPETPESTEQAFAPPDTGLIESTPGDKRAELVNKGRRDPFAEIVASPVSISPQNVPQQEVPKLPPLPTRPIRQPGQRPINPTNPFSIGQNIPSNRPTLTNPFTPPTPNNQPQTPVQPTITPVVPGVLPQVVPPKELEPVLPPPPQPTEAQGVFVSGVVLIGEKPQAIIKAPNEPTSRYVQAGQRLASGVLVKRIEMNAGSDPVVIFEQFGIEVAKAVGEKPITEESKTASSGNSLVNGTPL